MGGGESAEAVGRLVREYGERAFQFAYRLSGNAEESKDLVQEAYRRVLARWDRYDRAQPLANWFFTILRHVYADAARHRSRHGAVSLDAPVCAETGEPAYYAEVLPDGTGEALASLEHDESSRAVARAFEALGLEDRAVLTLREVEGLSYEEAARAMGLPLGTVRSRISRAREALKARYLAELRTAGAASPGRDEDGLP